MKKMKLLFFSTLIIICFQTFSSTVFAQGNTLDIDKVLDQAVENSYEVKTQGISLQKAQNSYKDALDNAPKINDQINKSDGTISYDEKFKLIQSRDNTPQEAKYSIYENTNEKEVAKKEVVFSVYQQYTALMDAKDELDTEQKRLDNAGADYKKAQIQLNLGMITQSSFTASEYAYYSENANFNKAQRQYDIETMKLNKLIGVPLETKYETLLKDKIAENIYIRDYNAYLSDALKNRAEILNSTEYINLMNYEFKIVKAFYPDTRDQEYKVGKYYITSAQTNLDMQKIKVSLEVNDLYNDLQNKTKQLDSQNDSLDYASQDYNKALQKYNLGLISKIDLDSKLIAFENQQNSLKSLKRDIWMAQVKLEYACKIGADTSKLVSQ
ncbi:TolC family protein [Clostridium sp. JNZ X4-2]